MLLDTGEWAPAAPELEAVEVFAREFRADEGPFLVDALAPETSYEVRVRGLRTTSDGKVLASDAALQRHGRAARCVASTRLVWTRSSSPPPPQQ